MGLFTFMSVVIVYFSFRVFLCFLCITASTMTTTRVMRHPATPAETDEAMMTTLFVGRVEGGRGGRGEEERGGGEGGGGATLTTLLEDWVSKDERGDALGEGGINKGEGEGRRGLHFSEGTLSSGSTG